MAKISVIIPVYNAEDFLPKCLDSLLNQTFSDFEVLAVNDGSRDGSLSILERYEREYPGKIRVLSQENGGQGSARNLGIEHAAGEYCLFMDSDDFVEPDMLEGLYQKAVRDRSDLVICDYREVEEATGAVSVRKAFPEAVSDIRKAAFLANPSPWNKLIRLSVLKENQIRFLEHHIYEDLATIPLVAACSRNISYLPQPYYHYLIRPDSTMRQKTYSSKLESIFPALEHLKKEMLRLGQAEVFSSELEYIYIEHLLYASSGRFLGYPEGRNQLYRMKDIMKTQYPHWKKNSYYQKKTIKFKIICHIFYGNKRWILKLYKALRGIKEG